MIKMDFLYFMSSKILIELIAFLCYTLTIALSKNFQVWKFLEKSKNNSFLVTKLNRMDQL